MTVSYYWFKSYKSIISKIYHILKQITAWSIVLSLALSYLTTPVLAAKTIEQIFTDMEEKYHIPTGLLLSIAKVESGMQPYVLNIAGKIIRAKSVEEAIGAIEVATNKGLSNVDIGVMQLNYRWHREGFESIEEMLNVEKNIEYAARFLADLKKQHGGWHAAIRRYNSANPKYYKKYSRKVVMAWISG